MSYVSVLRCHECAAQAINNGGDRFSVSGSGEVAVTGTLSVSSTATFSGPLTASNGLTVTRVGLTVTAGDMNIAAGDLTVTSGSLQVCGGAVLINELRRADRLPRGEGVGTYGLVASLGIFVELSAPLVRCAACV